MAVDFQNFYEATLTAPVGATDLVISLSPAPSVSEGWLLIDYDVPSKREFIYFTSKNSTSVTVASVGAGRGQDGTTATTHDQNAKVRMNVSAGILKGLRDGTALGTGFVTNAMLGDNTITPSKLVPSTSTTGAASPVTPSSDTGLYLITALAQATTINAPSGTPREGQGLILRIKDNGTARALTWNAIYRVVGITLPTTTTAGKLMYIGLRYNAVDTKWDVVSINREA